MASVWATVTRVRNTRRMASSVGPARNGRRFSGSRVSPKRAVHTMRAPASTVATQNTARHDPTARIPSEINGARTGPRRKKAMTIEMTRAIWSPR